MRLIKRWVGSGTLAIKALNILHGVEGEDKEPNNNAEKEKKKEVFCRKRKLWGNP